MSRYVIETKQLTKNYGEQTVVNAVNIHVEKGRIYGLLGRNGAGKTTIMKMILGLTPVTSGEVDVFGQNIKGREKRVYPRIGAIIETPGCYPNLTGTENLEIFARLRGTAAPNAVKNALDIVGLPYRDKKLFSKYSLGMKQRLGIANAILHDPELLILDEPTNGLDPIIYFDSLSGSCSLDFFTRFSLRKWLKQEMDIVKTVKITTNNQISVMELPSWSLKDRTQVIGADLHRDMLVGDILLGVQSGPDVLPPDHAEELLQLLLLRFPMLQEVTDFI